MLNKKKFVLSVILLLILITLTCGCNIGFYGGNSTDNNAVYKDFNNNDFSFKYPSEWDTSENNATLTRFKKQHEKIYSSGAISNNPNENQFFLMMCLNNDFPINEETLDNFMSNYKDTFENDFSSVVLISEHDLTIDNQIAKKVIYEYIYYDILFKSEIITTYKNNNFYFILCAAEKSNYDNTSGLFSEIVNSIELH